MSRPRKERLRVPGRPPLSGARALARRLAENALDQRTTTAKLLRMIADDLAADAGGWPCLSNREKVLVDRCAAQVLVLQSIENWVFRNGTVLDADGALLSVLRKGYVGHLNTLRLNLVALGLKPDRADRVPSLAEYLAARQTASGYGTTGPNAVGGVSGANSTGAVSAAGDTAPSGGASS